jgi:hypothetical protein
MNVKSLQKQLMAAVAMVIVAAIAMSSATYAWFVSNTQVTATNASVSAATAYSLLISQDNSTYGTTTKLDALPNNLTPVSTVGEINTTAAITLAAADGSTPAVGNGDNTEVALGDVRFVTGTKWESNYMTAFTEVSKNSVTASATTTESYKYFYTETVYLKAAQDSNLLLDSTGIGIVWAKYDADADSKFADEALISLSDFAALPTIATTGLSATTTPTKAAAEAYNEKLTSAQALLKTLRVGFTITQYTDGDVSKAVTSRKFYEYQLVSSSISDSTRVQTTLNSTAAAEGITKAVNASGQVASISTSAGTMSNGKTINDYAVAGVSSALVTAANQSNKTVLAAMSVNEVVKCDIYVWMEGCDEDTVAANINSFSGAGITGLQFGFCLGEVSST